MFDEEELSAETKHCSIDPSLADCDGEPWECAQLSDWTGVDGRPPWGEDTWEAMLTYLTTLTDDEHPLLADAAALSLDCGAWQGVKTPSGGWTDGPPWDEGERRWRATAADFLIRYERGERVLTEGMIAYATYDLCKELAYLRGWCPGKG